MVVLFPFLGDSLGGSHIAALNSIRCISAQGYDVLVGVHHEGVLSRYFDSQGIAWKKLPPVVFPRSAGRLRELFFTLRALIPLLVFLIKNHVRIVHTNDMRMHLAWLASARLAGCQHIWHQRSVIRARRYAILARVACKRVSVSRFVTQSFSRFGTNVPYQLYDAVSVFAAANHIAAAKNFFATKGGGRDVSVVSWVANYTAVKRPLLFVDIAKKVIETSSRSVVFAMFGDPRDMAVEVRAAIERSGLGGACLMMGVKTPIAPWIAASDVLVATAEGEGLGLTLIEAMMLGTPVVAANSGGHSEIITDRVTGRLVQSDVSDDFATAILELLDEPELAAGLASSALSFASEVFSLEVHDKNIASIYKVAL